MAGYSEPTFKEALHQYQRDTNLILHTILHKMGMGLPAPSKICKFGDNVWGVDYFHINYTHIKPTRVRYKPLRSTTLERKADKASERQYTNNTDAELIETYQYERGTEITKSTSERNMAGISISNALTIGTGEGAAVKLENTTEVTVSAEFERARSQTETESKTETDITQITIPPHTTIQVHQQRYSAKIEQIDEIHLEFDIGFNIHNHAKHARDVPGMYPNKDYQKTGTYARRFMKIKSLEDFRVMLRGIHSSYPHLTKNFLKNDTILAALETLKENSVFITKEKTIFKEGSYGEVVVDQKDT